MKTIFYILFIVTCVTLVVCPKAIGNSLNLLDRNNFFIPKESCICDFSSNMTDEGSGEGWLYGEDDKFYYGINVDIDLEKDHPAYFILRKGQESQNFDKFNYHTWDKKKGVKWLPKKLRWDTYLEEGYEE